MVVAVVGCANCEFCDWGEDGPTGRAQRRAIIRGTYVDCCAVYQPNSFYRTS
jgi:hypothetical protein